MKIYDFIRMSRLHRLAAVRNATASEIANLQSQCILDREIIAVNDALREISDVRRRIVARQSTVTERVKKVCESIATWR